MKTVRKDGPVLGLKSVNHAYGDAYDAEDVRDLEQFKPLTAEEVQNLRRQQPLLSVWRVVLAQMMVGMAVAALTWFLTVPAALFARGLTSKATMLNSGTAVFGFLLWELVKIGLTIAMLYAAVWLVKDLSWPAMLVGLVVTMKVYWVVFAWRNVFHPVT
jgi:ATP synthase protein I